MRRRKHEQHHGGNADDDDVDDGHHIVRLMSCENIFFITLQQRWTRSRCREKAQHPLLQTRSRLSFKRGIKCGS